MCKPLKSEKKEAPLKIVSPLTIGVVFAAYIALNHIDLVILFLPKYIDAYFFRLWFYGTRSKRNANVPIRDPVISRVPYHDEPVTGINDVFDKNGYPRLVKNFVKVDQDKIVDYLHEKNKGREMGVLEFEVDDNWIDHFSPSCGRNVDKHALNMTFDEFAERALYESSAKKHSGLYAGFETITDPQTVTDILGFDIHNVTTGTYRSNNLFGSNFPKDIISASLHCAPIDSVAVQLFGTKTWMFVSPKEVNKIGNLPFPTILTFPLTDDELLSQVDNIYVAVQKPGDLLYFGPNWCHAVHTSTGPNFMFNIRYFNKEKLLTTTPKKQVFKALTRKLSRGSASKPSETSGLYPILYNDLMNWMDNCGPSKAMDRLMSKVYAMIKA